MLRAPAPLWKTPAVLRLFAACCAFPALAVVVRSFEGTGSRSTAVGSTLPVVGKSLARCDAITDLGKHRVPTRLQDICTPEMLTRSACFFHSAFMDKDHQPWFDKLSEAFLNLRTTAMMTISEWHSSTMLNNFLANARMSSVRDDSDLTVVNVALEPSSHEMCEGRRNALARDKFHIKCVDMSGWLPSYFFSGFEELARGAGNAGFWSCTYNATVWTKPLLFATAVMASPHGVLLMDLDVIVHHNLLTYVADHFPSKNGSYLLTAQEHCGRANTGSVFAVSESRYTLERWIQRNMDTFGEDYNGDQGSIRWVLTQGKHLKRTDWRYWEKFPMSVVNQCTEHGEFATHYNCLPSKKTRMKKHGDWNINVAETYQG